MAMRENGLTKLSEEAAEVIQVAQKLIAYPELQTKLYGERGLHPDGTNLRERLVEELGDLKAAILFITTKLELNENALRLRTMAKLHIFQQWDNE